MGKKILILGLTLMMCLGAFSGCCNENEYKEGDFRLTVAASQTEARLGDTVEITATLTNVSGRNITIRLTPRHTDLKLPMRDTIMIECSSTSMDEFERLIFAVEPVAGRQRREVINKDKSITRTLAFLISDLKDYDAGAAILFYNSNKKDSLFCKVLSETIKIAVVGD